MRALSLACVCLTVAVSATPENLLTNGSFNGDLDGWGTWSSVAYDATLDATGTSGSGSARTSASAGAVTDALAQCVAIGGSTQYQVGGKASFTSGEATNVYAVFFLMFFSSADCSGDPTTSTYLSDHGVSAASWATFEDNVTSPSGAQSVNVFVAVRDLNTTGSPGTHVNFDDLYLTGSSGVSYSRWIPAVIHKDVPSKSAKWRSDVAVLNHSTSTANLTITMYPAAGPVSQTAQLTGMSQLLLTDVAGWLGVAADSGPLKVTSDQKFFLSGRTYNQVDASHTYGQDYDGQETSELLAAGDSSTSTAWLPQLTENSFYRTNIGITNTGTGTANVTVTGYDGSGNQVWSDTKDYQAGGFYQYQQPYLAFGGIGNAYAKVTVNSGSGVVAYASVVDANTGDPTTITMKW